MHNSFISKKVFTGIAVIIGVFFIITAICCLYPYLGITILRQWPAYLDYLRQIHSNILTNNIRLMIAVLLGILDGIHQMVTGIILILSCKKTRYWKGLIACGLVLIFFLIEIVISYTIMDMALTFKAVLGRLLLALFVICYGLYLQHSNKKEQM